MRLALELQTLRTFRNVMNPAFSIITSVYDTFLLLPRLAACVLSQTWSDWELILVVDGPAPAERYAPPDIARQLRRAAPGRRIEVFERPPAPGCHGNMARNFGLHQARGEYVVWVNHDNLIWPHFLATHAANRAAVPGCVSLVDIDLWQIDRYRGRFPRGYRAGRIDLLNFALPRPLALAVNAFGDTAATEYAADWLLFESCRQQAPIHHTPLVCGVHF